MSPIVSFQAVNFAFDFIPYCAINTHFWKAIKTFLSKKGGRENCKRGSSCNDFSYRYASKTDVITTGSDGRQGQEMSWCLVLRTQRRGQLPSARVWYTHARVTSPCASWCVHSRRQNYASTPLVRLRFFVTNNRRLYSTHDGCLTRGLNNRTNHIGHA